MPAFGDALSDADMVALLRYLRGRFSAQPPWDGLERLVADTRSGAIVKPGGIRNQTEGGIIQAMSWPLFERIAYDDTRVTSVDRASYPILRFANAPDRINLHIVERPGDPFLGTGEAAQGPTTAAVGNAFRSATGRRLRDLPFTPDRVRKSTATGRARPKGATAARRPAERTGWHLWMKKGGGATQGKRPHRFPPSRCDKS
ncbi:hypothetical protein [Azospirillum argentinense]